GVDRVDYGADEGRANGIPRRRAWHGRTSAVGRARCPRPRGVAWSCPSTATSTKTDMARFLHAPTLAASPALVGAPTAADAEQNEARFGPAGDDVAYGSVHTTAARIPVEDNPLLAEWTGPYGGVPPFDRVRIEHFKPALETAMREQLEEIERIVANPEPPTFENTIVALERSGRTLDRVMAVYGVWASNMSSPEFQAVEREMAPRLAEFSDRITQNEALFRRIEAVYESPEKAELTPEQQRLVWLYYTNFVRAGAKLGPQEKARLSEINQRLAELFTKFNQNVLADESDRYLVLESEADLAGLPEALRQSAAAEAESRSLAGKWVIANTRSSMEPFLTYSDRRDLRERAWRLW